MPWWIWLVLALFMLAMIIAGLVYAGVHGMHALRDVSEIGGRLGEKFAEMSDTDDDHRVMTPVSFTQPLSAAQDRYADAHAEVIKRKAAKRERHIQAWNRWKRFNN
ncbi:hypothetical protein BLI708_09860 [Bifidobacterium imperatoris]|uniref:Uncharacterized protein n=1 Tax=Bifidobacterium imperatoris TaxID=2020965 RepID=A0A2N5IS12_9BIFI|nr:hypothetical protein [Bifidobacterium imperatoris]PLS24730.1 hypothetical protein Tam1G_1318 [Bifidobacterium imperatoris]QSY57510.1 hypothetical protein BLI708_09860 [Bifidobacterium imperatoris]